MKYNKSDVTKELISNDYLTLPVNRTYNNITHSILRVLRT